MDAILRGVPGGSSAFAMTTEAETPQQRIDRLNAQSGTATDPRCPHCRGKGYVYFLDGTYERTRECVCMAEVRAAARAKKSGLGELYDIYTLENYGTQRKWQAAIKAKAETYIAAKRGWFFVCGRSGSGKTHIITAIARELIKEGFDTRYLIWRSDAMRLKRMINEPAYEAAMREYMDCDLLVIDDLWQGENVSEADRNLAFEIINARYNAPSRLTLLSSEKPLNKICSTSEPVGGRIYQRARGFVLQTGDENLRLSGCEGQEQS